MKALILVGGFGTRLRPLTIGKPKPLVPFVNKPMIIHQIEALKAVGVDEVVLAIAYQPDLMKAEMEEWSQKLGVKFTYSHEKEPLGTAGPLALAAEHLQGDDQPFFVLNADVTCTFPLKELLAYHKKRGGEGTIMVTKVKEWQKYGVVVYDDKEDSASFGRISTFAEKPKEFVGDKINAGIYIFNKSILKRIKIERTSIETQVFPAMAADKTLFAMELPGFWMDIGQPHDYIDGLGKFLPALVGTEREKQLLVSAEEAAKRGFVVHGCVVIDPTATIESGAELGPNVTIGAKCRVKSCARLANAAVLTNSVIGKGAFVSRAIIGWNNTVGNWSRVVENTVTGDDVHIKPELYVNGAKVLPNKNINVSVERPEIIM